MKKSKTIVTICIILILVGVITTLKFLKIKSNTIEIGDKFDPKSKGNPKARVKIEEYSDFQCISCAWGTTILDEYVTAYPQEIYVKFNHFPSSKHKYAFKLAVYAECAAKQDRFWDLHDLFFKQQNKLKKSTNIDRDLKSIAEKAGIDMGKYILCIKEKDKKNALIIKTENGNGKSRGVKSTPTYFINGKMVVGITALIDEMGQYFNYEERNR